MSTNGQNLQNQRCKILTYLFILSQSLQISDIYKSFWSRCNLLDYNISSFTAGNQHFKNIPMKTFEQDNLSGTNHEGAHPNSPLKFLTASSIIGDEILNPSGEKLGKINDIMIELSNGKIEYVVIELGGFLGIGEKYFAIPFALLEVDAKNEVFILDQTKETLEAAPGFDKDHWPETTSREFDNSSTYWGGFMGVNIGGVPY